MQELIKQTDKGHPDRKSLERALDEMQDLSLYVNEVKRDNEALQLITEIQNRWDGIEGDTCVWSDKSYLSGSEVFCASLRCLLLCISEE